MNAESLEHVTTSERNAAKVFATQEMLRRLLRMHADHWTHLFGLFSGSGTDIAWQIRLVDHLIKQGILEQGQRKAATKGVDRMVYRLRHHGTRLKVIGELLDNDDLLRQVAIDMKALDAPWLTPPSPEKVPERAPERPERSTHDAYVRDLLKRTSDNVRKDFGSELSDETRIFAASIKENFSTYSTGQRADKLRALTERIARERTEDKKRLGAEHPLVNALKGLKSTEVAAKLVGITMWTFRQALDKKETPVVAPVKTKLTSPSLPPITPPAEKGKIRIPLDVSEKVYDSIKAMATRRNKTVQKYLLSLLAADGIRTNDLN